MDTKKPEVVNEKATAPHTAIPTHTSPTVPHPIKAKPQVVEEIKESSLPVSLPRTSQLERIKVILREGGMDSMSQVKALSKIEDVLNESPVDLTLVHSNPTEIKK